MAQQLKPEVREAIINASKDEFLNYGYDNASMRRIAQKANMTVGNLYRYFANKQAINETIVTPVLNEINEMVKEISKDSVDMKSSKFTIKLKKDELIDMIETLSNKFVDIYYHHQDELNILFMKSEITSGLIDWFTSLLVHLIDDKYKIIGFKKEKEKFARCYAVSIISGIIELFKNNNISKDYLKIMLKIYFKSYISMMDIDVRKFLR